MPGLEIIWKGHIEFSAWWFDTLLPNNNQRDKLTEEKDIELEYQRKALKNEQHARKKDQQALKNEQQAREKVEAEKEAMRIKLEELGIDWDKIK